MKHTRFKNFIFNSVAAFSIAIFLSACDGVKIKSIFGDDSGTACTAANQTDCRTTASFKSQAVPGTPAIAANVANGKQFYAGGALVTGTMTINTLSAASTTVNAGYFAATTLDAVDTDLVSTNIKSGITLFGIAGDSNVVNTNSGDAIAAEIFTGKKGWVSGAEVTGTMADRGGAWAITTAFPGAGYYSGITSGIAAANVCSTANFLGATGTAFCSTAGSLTMNNIAHATDTTKVKVPAAGASYNSVTLDLGVDFTAENICTGTTIYGRTGTTDCSGAGAIASMMGSNIHRTTGGTPTQITVAQEAGAIAAGYSIVPDPTKDDNGYAGTSVTKATRPTKACGMAIATLTGRITDCVDQNGSLASWNGARDGNSGEGSWTLVTAYLVAGANGTLCAGNCYEIWRDDRTGLLWSDRMTVGTDNWCRAAGNVQNAGTVDCSAGGSYQPASPESWCAEEAGLTTPAARDVSKGNMLKTATATTPAVRWRLPTRSDYYQANVDGLRFVLPHVGVSYTATTYSSTRGKSFVFYETTGESTPSAKSNALQTRCVGK